MLRLLALGVPSACGPGRVRQHQRHGPRQLGAVLPGVTVTITSLERTHHRTVVTNESGFYTKERLLPGTYEVQAELPGFKQAVFTGVNVSVDTRRGVDFALELGELSETVDGHRRLRRCSRPIAPTWPPRSTRAS